MTRAPSPYLDAALALASERGFEVLPVVGKCPVAPRGYWSATNDPDEIRSLFAPVRATGVGIGAVDQLVILDIDSREAVEALPSMPRTLTAQSGGGDGHWHVYFLRPPGLSLSYREDRWPVGIEVKLGGNGTVAPPSLHPKTGEPYRWVRSNPVAPALVSVV